MINENLIEKFWSECSDDARDEVLCGQLMLAQINPDRIKALLETDMELYQAIISITEPLKEFDKNEQDR